jgi:hypothetical protein
VTSRRSLSLAVLALMSGVMGCGWFDVTRREPDPQLQESMDAAPPDAGPEAGVFPPDAGMDASDGAWIDPPDADAEAGPQAGSHPEYPPLDADLRWHPEPGRLSIVNESLDHITQPRAWLLVHGGDTRRRLVSYRLDQPGVPWFDTGISDITSSPKAVSWYRHDREGDRSQRVFFARNGKLHMLRYGDSDALDRDGSVIDPLEVIDVELGPGYALGGGTLTADVIRPHGEDIMVIVAPALRDGVAGYYCAFEYRIADEADEEDEWSAECSDTIIFSATTELVSGTYDHRVVVIGAGDDFVCRLCGLEREPDGLYSSGGPTWPGSQKVGASLSLVQGAIDPSVLHLYVAAQDGSVWHGSYDMVSFAQAWTELPALPVGVNASNGRAAINALEIRPDANHLTAYTAIYVLGDDGAVYYNQAQRDQNGDDQWQQEWDRVASPGRDQITLALGGIMSQGRLVPPANDFRAFSSSLNIVGGARATTVQEATEVAGEIVWRDHVRADASSRVVIPAPASAESSVASSADIGIAATAVRGPSAPFTVMLSGSIDNASSWHSFALETLPAESAIDAPASSASAPVTASDGKRLHLVNLESDMDTDCSSAGDNQRIVYRRGEDVRVLAQLSNDDSDLFQVASSGRYSDPSLVVTVEDGDVIEDRESTAHVLWNDLTDDRVHYWRLPPLGDPYKTPLDATKLPISSLRLISSGAGEAIYAAAGGPQHLRICDLNALPLDDDSCVFVAFGQLSLRYAEISFGASEPASNDSCEPVEDEHFKCMRDGLPFAVAGDHRIANKLYAVYAAEDTAAGLDVERGSIFFTHSTGGAEIGDWSNPVRVNPRATGETLEYFDAELAVDAQGGVFVTYAAIEPQSADTSVRVYAAYWDGEGIPRFDAPTQVASWDASRLPYDCTTGRWALGDYRDPDTIGGRSLHVLRADDGGSEQQVTRWLSPYAPP